MKPLIITFEKETIYNSVIKQSLLRLFSASIVIHHKCDILIIGKNIESIVNQISKYKIIDKIFIIKLDNLENFFIENVIPSILNFIKNYSHILMQSSLYTKNLLPRLAGILGCSMISDIIEIIDSNTFRRLIYTGNISVQIKSLDTIKLLSIRTANFNTYNTLINQDKEIIYLNYLAPKNYISLIKTLHSDILSLDNAKIIVSGGRALLNKENFSNLIGGVAKKINASIGASKMAVDENIALNECQIGQTGTIVSPNIYLAIGISGAMQHIVGIKNTKTIIAINIDKNAPIFEFADYGLVGDLFDIIPKLIKIL